MTEQNKKNGGDVEIRRTERDSASYPKLLGDRKEEEGCHGHCSLGRQQSSK